MTAARKSGPRQRQKCASPTTANVQDFCNIKHSTDKLLRRALCAHRSPLCVWRSVFGDVRPLRRSRSCTLSAMLSEMRTYVDSTAKRKRSAFCLLETRLCNRCTAACVGLVWLVIALSNRAEGHRCVLCKSREPPFPAPSASPPLCAVALAAVQFRFFVSSVSRTPRAVAACLRAGVSPCCFLRSVREFSSSFALTRAQSKARRRDAVAVGACAFLRL